ncbi:MAG: hypothetical protein PHQ05_00215 [Sterolibacterium sp.]|nr:hypothetical protein [Sterolibacterium sp.]
MKFLLRQLPFTALLAGSVNFGYAQSDSLLSDPTRPPTTVVEPASTATTEGVPPPSGLQSIILGKGRKPMAVINGVAVELGDKIGDATLVKISESEVVLKGPAGKEILYLTPGVEKINVLNPKLGIGVEHGRAATGKPKPEPAQ